MATAVAQVTSVAFLGGPHNGFEALPLPRPSTSPFDTARRFDFECLVVGGGPAGLAAATALANLGIETALAGPVGVPSGRGNLLDQPMPADTRTAALFPPVVTLLRRLGAWDALAPASAPLRGIRIIDATGHVLRAPAVVFSAAEIGAADLGYNIPNAGLTAALRSAAEHAGVRVLGHGPVTSIDIDDAGATVHFSTAPSLKVSLIVGADGRQSICRQAAGIACRTWTYDQTALATRFAHSRPHRGISTELHRPAGPCTTVPLSGNHSSLVWVERPAVAEDLAALDDTAFLAALEGHLEGLLGTLSDPGPRRRFPLAGMHADTLGARRVALVGEAGHVLPPIGAQGLNLGMVDAAVLADLVGAQKAAGRDLGAPDLLNAYDHARSKDIRVRQGLVDAANRSLTSGFLPLDLMRGAGLHMLAAAAPLRRRLIEQGLSPPLPLPSLMRDPAADRAPRSPQPPETAIR